MDKMNNVKPTLIDLEKYVVHTKNCGARVFYHYAEAMGRKNVYGECDCGLHDLLDALGIRKRKLMEYY